MSYPAIAHIDLAALQHNLQHIKAKTPQSKVLAMVKCNAYGHGVIPVAQTIESQIAAFGVAFVREAVELHNSGVKKSIVILTGFLTPEELRTIDQFGFATVIHNTAQLELLDQIKLTHKLAVWLKIDTGMHRLGFQADKVATAYARLQAHPMVQKPLHLMTHFSDADEITKPKTAEQIACFRQIVADLEGEWCLANSAAILHWSNSHQGWIRPGITLHGVSPVSGQLGTELGLKPVMTVTSRLIAIHTLAKGETVSYGSTWVCPEKMPVGIISFGYGHGYPRSAPSGTPVLVNGIRTQIIGRVAMDMMTVDLRPISDAELGDPVVLWGQGLPVEEIAECVNTIPYELFCRLTSRLHYHVHYYD